jgi:hypothetical protein
VTREKLAQIIKELLNTDADFAILRQPEENHLEMLTACIGERIDQSRG